MNNDMYKEDNISKFPAIELLKKLGYTYISPEECLCQRVSRYGVILKDILRDQLNKLNGFTFGGKDYKFSKDNIERAITELDEPLTEGLIRTNQKIYDDYMLGRSFPETLDDGRTMNFNLRYIDWDDISNNAFHITEEYAVESRDNQHNARPDIVLFVNGIPFAVVECKSPLITADQAIEQMLRNQLDSYIPQLFKFVQIVVATNKNTLKYATTGTPKKFWSVWKEEEQSFLSDNIKKHTQGRKETQQDKDIISLLEPSRLMELTRYFVLFDANVKKICRHQQYFAVRDTIKTINEYEDNGNRKSGVIWHTQGSGKSLTMVMLAKYILTTMTKDNPKVIVITDRKDLDRQISDTFSHTKLFPATATSGKHLVSLIKGDKASIITSVINKFNTAENCGVKVMSKNIFVLVDESHRSNYGELSTKMRTVFPNACYIGFTGTPLMKKEKSTMQRFGKLIHKYTIKDGVNDKAIVPLIYEGRFVDQKVDEEEIDLWFEKTTRKLTESQQADLKNKWSSIKRLTSTNARIRKIAFDIDEHFTIGYKDTGFKAMLATNFKRDAVRYLEVFEQLGDLKCAVVISSPDMREGVEDIDDAPDDKVIAFWNKMMNKYHDEDTYEETIRNKFCDGEIDILIVCSKLLTGFDAPICQVLYIDKELKEHSLLQAIARTNRLADGKDYGLIVDYRGLIDKLDDAMNMYSGSGLEYFDGSDLAGAIVDIMSAVSVLRQAYSQLCDLFSSIKNKNDMEEIEDKLEDNKIREEFYKLLCAFGKALSVVLNSEKAYEAVPKEEIEKYKADFKMYSQVRRSVKIRYFDAVDNKEYEPQMQNLLDQYLSVASLKHITNPVNIFNEEELQEELSQLTTKRSQADAIRTRLTKTISEKYDENPAYYDSFSKKIKEALEQYKQKVITEAEYLNKMHAILNDFSKGTTDITYPEKIKNNVHAQAFYGVISAVLESELDLVEYIDMIADISCDITDIIKNNSKVDWADNAEIHKRIEQDIDDLFWRYGKKYNISFDYDTVDKIIENVKTIALRRF